MSANIATFPDILIAPGKVMLFRAWLHFCRPFLWIILPKSDILLALGSFWQFFVQFWASKSGTGRAKSAPRDIFVSREKALNTMTVCEKLGD